MGNAGSSGTADAGCEDTTGGSAALRRSPAREKESGSPGSIRPAAPPPPPPPGHLRGVGVSSSPLGLPAAPGPGAAGGPPAGAGRSRLRMSFTEKGVGSIVQAGPGAGVRVGGLSEPQFPQRGCELRDPLRALTLLCRRARHHPRPAAPGRARGGGPRGLGGAGEGGSVPGGVCGVCVSSRDAPARARLPIRLQTPSPAKQGEASRGLEGAGVGLRGNKTNRVDFSSIKVTLASAFGR